MATPSELHPTLSSRVGGGAGALLLVDDSGVIEAANAAAEHLFRYDPRGLDGEAIECLVPESVRERHGGLVSGFFADPAIRDLGTRTLTAVRSDGSEFPADILLFPFTRSGKTVVLVGVVDLTIQTAIEQAMNDIRSTLSEVENRKEQISPDEYRRMIRQVCDVSLQALSEAAGSSQGKDDSLLEHVASQEKSHWSRFAQLFESMPMPVWETDYSGLEPWFETLRADGVRDLDTYFDAHPESLDHAIGKVQIRNRNQAAVDAALYVVSPGVFDPEAMPGTIRSILRERVIGFFEGHSVVESEIHEDDSELGKQSLLVTAWAREHDDGRLDLSSVFSTMVDLEPFHLLEMERRIALEQFERVFDNAAAGITILDTDDGVLVRANRAFSDMLGYPEGDLDGVHLSDITPSSALTHLDEFISPTSRDERDVAVFERPYLHRDGETLWGRVSTRSSDPSGDAPSLAIAVITDVTDLRAERFARAEAERVLEARNAELQTFAWTAAHDLSEPLRKIRVFGERLIDTAGDALDDRSRDYLERMESAAERMQSLIDGLLEYSRITTRAQSFERVDLYEITRGVVSDLEVAIAGTGATIEIGDLPSVMAEPTQMRQLIQNLISNSLKYRSSERLPVVFISGYSDDANGVVFSVSDNGMGFEQGQSERIFGLFERLHGRSEMAGSGMGLAIVRKIVETHGGSITAESTPGSGATFTVHIPAARQENVTAHS